MTPKQQAVIDELRQEGYAIAIFAPVELNVVHARSLERFMVEAATEEISEVINENRLTLRYRYEIYREHTLDNPPKTYTEWLST